MVVICIHQEQDYCIPGITKTRNLSENWKSGIEMPGVTWSALYHCCYYIRLFFVLTEQRLFSWHECQPRFIELWAFWRTCLAYAAAFPGYSWHLWVKCYCGLSKTRSSAIAEGPRDASCQLKSCQLPRNSAETTYMTNPDQIDGMKLEI